MILKVEVKVNKFNRKKLNDKGYCCEIDEVVSLDINDTNGHGKSLSVTHKCDVCGNIFISHLLKTKTCSPKCRTLLLWQDEDFRKKINNVYSLSSTKEHYRNAMIEKWKNNDYRKKVIENSKKSINTEQELKRRSISGKKNWDNVDYAHKVLMSCVKYKDFTLPSGKIVKLQGYEPQVLTELLKTYSEDDIVIGVKDMNITIKKIKYVYRDTIHTYYPDFYIKSTNTIVEVKSSWTYKLHKKRNLAKQNACLQQGFNFEFRILF